MRKIQGIDMHNHWLPKTYFDYVKKGKLGDLAEVVETDQGTYLHFPGPEPGKKIKMPYTQDLYDWEYRFKEMDETGIAVAAVCPSPQSFHYLGEVGLVTEITRMLNDCTEEAAQKAPERLKPLAHVPLQSVPAAIEELERTMKRGFSGVHIASNIKGKYLGDLSFWPFFEAAESLGAYILIHPWDVAAYDRLQDYYLRNLIGNPLDTTITAGSMIFSGLLDRFPGLKICLCHSGGQLPYLIGRFNHGYQERPECKKPKNPPSEYLRSFYYDHITHSKQILQYLIGMVGSDRVLLGTDYPFDMGLKRPVDKLDELNLGSADYDNISFKNAAKILGI